jgi:hypothetical protein
MGINLNKSSSTNEGLPANEYLIAMKRFDRKISKAGKPYLHGLFMVIAGPAKKRTFWDNMSLDQGSGGAMFRLKSYCLEAGMTESDLDSFEIDSDDYLREKLCMRPIKVRLRRTTDNGYVNNSIERILTGDAVSPRDRDAMEKWLVDLAAESEVTGSSNDGGYDGSYDDAPHAADGDDIPF